MFTIASEVEGIDVLFMPRERMPDSARLDVPYLQIISVRGSVKTISYRSWEDATNPDLLILRTSCKIFTIWTEANTPNVEISIFVHRIILQFGDLVT